MLTTLQTGAPALCWVARQDNMSGSNDDRTRDFCKSWPSAVIFRCYEVSLLQLTDVAIVVTPIDGVPVQSHAIRSIHHPGNRPSFGQL